MNLMLQSLRIRMIENHIAKLYPTDKIQSPVHLSNGQEAISVGVCAALDAADLVFGTYRGHALYLAKGGSLKRMMAELYGKRTGCGGGKAGSMHLSAKEVGMMGASAIVGGSLPHSVGAAYAAKLRKTGQVVACFFGEGSTSEGVYHETLNFAAMHQVPILFVCENNGLAIFTQERDTNVYQVVEHAKSYGIPAQHCAEGADPNRVFAAAQERVRAIRNGAGPQLIEYKTFRYKQHVGTDDTFVVDPRYVAEHDAWEAQDPLMSLAGCEDEIRRIEQEIAEAIEFAEQSPFPQPSDLYAHVY
jgi:TPP-dependent pyruvate/acetoin dehydrogenase alpha subunit